MKLKEKYEETTSLGRFIEALKKLPPEAELRYDFGYCYPTGFHSYRGDYSELALGFDASGHGFTNSNDFPTVAEILKKAEDALGSEFTGWKGGDFTMYDTTPLWMDNYGDWSSTAIVGIKRQFDTLYIIKTKKIID